MCGGCDVARHVVPSHVWAYGPESSPIAMQKLRDVHDTAASIPGGLPTGWGMSDQLLPFGRDHAHP